MLSSNQFKKTKILKNLLPDELKFQAINLGRGEISDTGALVINTGKFTGRSPKDKFFVREADSEKNIDWNDFNLPIEEKYFLKLREDIIAYLDSKENIWVREVYAGAEEKYRISITVVTEYPESSLFALNMFIEPDDRENFKSEWTILQAPDFFADPQIHGTRQGNFAIISLAHKTVLIGGTGYTGEIKKGIFSIMNYLLPVEHNVLSMHCSANVGKKGDVAIFFGLSGTGKTTLSADPNRYLIGDDEHGWSSDKVFNIEGGCYAKAINLSKEKEPQIFNAIHGAALVENTKFIPGTTEIDFDNTDITENTRVSYPLEYIEGAVIPSVAGTPRNIFFLTFDAFGILPPVSKLSPDQAMFYFLSGYTAKVAGTEVGVKEPKSTFSTCFGAPFLPLSPVKYAEMLGNKIKENNVKVWMINTGWTGGGYTEGRRIKLSHTRTMINAILDGEMDQVPTQKHSIFGLEMPVSVPGVPSEILNPENTWANKDEYMAESKKLAAQFITNFDKFKDKIGQNVLKAASF